jgi:iron complex transport system substrate-binding protein
MFKKIIGAVSALVLLTTVPSYAATGDPKRIISLSPSATEDLFAIGAGLQVIAVDDLSNYPTSAPITKLSAFTPNVEAIAAYQPDLVVLNANATKAQDIQSALEKLKIKVFVEHAPNTLADAYSEITALGTATGNLSKAQMVISEMKLKISKIIATAKRHKPLYIFHELDNTLYSATSNTFIGHVYADFKLVNIADKAAKADDAGYPQLQSEYIIKTNPQIIFLSDAQDGVTPATVAKRAGWSGISAVKKHQIVALPKDIPSRWGPRLVDFYQSIATAIGSAN